MKPIPANNGQLATLATYLGSRRAAILRAWRHEVDRDPQLTTASTISRSQFNDRIPDVLDAFEQKLKARNLAEQQQAQEQESERAGGHGEHRWQQGYDQREAICEWGHLHLVLLQEFDRFSASRPELDPQVMATARMLLVELCNTGVAESAARYARLQRAEAATRVRELEQALTALQSLDRQRAEGWREAAHDLRGSVNTISNATALLERPDVPALTRQHASRVLRTGVSSLRDLLEELMDLARLEAGHERRNVAAFDAATVLKEFCETLRPLASEHGLFLMTEGPAALAVEGDPGKVRRIVQNLVLNALQATQRGGVRVMWQEAGLPGREQWSVCIQDTGPGLSSAGGTPLTDAIRHATEDAHDVEVRAERAGDASAQTEAAPTLASQSPGEQRDSHGEGIGLSIVKRLCELLDASVELESSPGAGTTFRVTFPRRYDRA